MIIDCHRAAGPSSFVILLPIRQQATTLSMGLSSFTFLSDASPSYRPTMSFQLPVCYASPCTFFPAALGLFSTEFTCLGVQRTKIGRGDSVRICGGMAGCFGLLVCVVMGVTAGLLLYDCNFAGPFISHFSAGHLLRWKKYGVDQPLRQVPISSVSASVARLVWVSVWRC
jgi:hypothetical protein